MSVRPEWRQIEGLPQCELNQGRHHIDARRNLPFHAGDLMHNPSANFQKVISKRGQKGREIRFFLPPRSLTSGFLSRSHRIKPGWTMSRYSRCEPPHVLEWWPKMWADLRWLAHLPDHRFYCHRRRSAFLLLEKSQCTIVPKGFDWLAICQFVPRRTKWQTANQ